MKKLIAKFIMILLPLAALPASEEAFFGRYEYYGYADESRKLVLRKDHTFEIKSKKTSKTPKKGSNFRRTRTHITGKWKIEEGFLVLSGKGKFENKEDEWASRRLEIRRKNDAIVIIELMIQEFEYNALDDDEGCLLATWPESIISYYEKKEIQPNGGHNSGSSAASIVTP